MTWMLSRPLRTMSKQELFDAGADEVNARAITETVIAAVTVKNSAQHFTDLFISEHIVDAALTDARPGCPVVLERDQARALLDCYGIETMPYITAASVDEGLAAAETLVKVAATPSAWLRRCLLRWFARRAAQGCAMASESTAAKRLVAAPRRQRQASGELFGCRKSHARPSERARCSRRVCTASQKDCS